MRKFEKVSTTDPASSSNLDLCAVITNRQYGYSSDNVLLMCMCSVHAAKEKTKQPQSKAIDQRNYFAWHICAWKWGANSVFSSFLLQIFCRNKNGNAAKQQWRAEYIKYISISLHNNIFFFFIKQPVFIDSKSSWIYLFSLYLRLHRRCMWWWCVLLHFLFLRWKIFRNVAQ